MQARLFSLVVGGAALVATQALSAQRGNQSWEPVPVPTAVRAANSRFAGTWRLVGHDTRDPKGQLVSPGPETRARGYIIYHPAGYMAVVTESARRPTFAGAYPTPEEARAAMTSYGAYWGSYAVNEATSVVTHHTFGAISTATSGTNQVRPFTFAGNRLTLRPPATASGNQPSLTWERVPDLTTLTPTHRKLIGFWKLILMESRNAKGEVLATYPGQTGFIIYTASGHVMVHMMQPYRRRSVGDVATPEETMAAYRTYTSYAGPYEINESGQYLVHHLASAMNPNLVGTDFQRYFEFVGSRLILKPPVTKNTTGEDVHMTITWERLGD